MSPEQCRAARSLLGLSQADLASRAGVACSTLRAFESGRTTTFTANVCSSLLRVFGQLGVNPSAIPMPGSAGAAHLGVAARITALDDKDKAVVEHIVDRLTPSRRSGK